MTRTDDTRRRWQPVCQLDAWSSELHDQAGQCDAVLDGSSRLARVRRLHSLDS
jgi:hypothetical protein